MKASGFLPRIDKCSLSFTVFMSDWDGLTLVGGIEQNFTIGEVTCSFRGTRYCAVALVSRSLCCSVCDVVDGISSCDLNKLKPEFSGNFEMFSLTFFGGHSRGLTESGVLPGD